MLTATQRILGTLVPVALVVTGFTVPSMEAQAADSCSTLASPVYQTINPKSSTQLLTPWRREAQGSTTRYGFTEVRGVLGYGSISKRDGYTAIQRMYNPGSRDFLWVTSADEIAKATASGYVSQNVTNFYAPTSPSSCTVAVHRFVKGTHTRNAWTAMDKAALTAAGWTDAGASFYLRPTNVSTPTPSAPTPTPSTASPSAASPSPTQAGTPTPTKPAATTSSTPSAPAGSTPQASVPPTTTAPARTPQPSTSASTEPPSVGVPRGTSLTKVSGDIVITKDGTVLENVDVRGYISVRANNVTIKNSIIRGGDTATSSKALVMNWGTGKNLVVKDTTLVPNHPSIWLDGISGKNLTAARVDISGVVDGVKVIGSGVTVKDSYLHDAYYQASGVSYQADGQTHNDAVQVEGGGDIALTGNTMAGFHNAAVMVTQNAALITGLTISDNVLSDGGCTVNMAEKGKGAMEGVKLVYNRFGPNNTASTSCPVIMPYSTMSEAQISGNTWLANGAAVTARIGN